MPNKTACIFNTYDLPPKVILNNQTNMLLTNMKGIYDMNV